MGLFKDILNEKMLKINDESNPIFDVDLEKELISKNIKYDYIYESEDKDSDVEGIEIKNCESINIENKLNISYNKKDIEIKNIGRIKSNHEAKNIINIITDKFEIYFYANYKKLAIMYK